MEAFWKRQPAAGEQQTASRATAEVLDMQAKGGDRRRRQQTDRAKRVWGSRSIAGSIPALSAEARDAETERAVSFPAK